MNQLEKFNKLIEFFFAENARFFEYYMGIFGLQDWRKSNMIWDALYERDGSHFRLRHLSCVYITAQRQYTAVQKMRTPLKKLFLHYNLE